MEDLKNINLDIQESLEVELIDPIQDSIDLNLPIPAIVQGGSNIRVQDEPKENGRDAFSTGGAYNLQQQINGKANKEDIPAVPTKLSELENDSKFIDESTLNSKEFVTVEEVEGAIETLTNEIVEVLVTEFVTKYQLEQKGYLTSEDIEGLATEQYVNGIVGEINLVLDMINGEVI